MSAFSVLLVDDEEEFVTLLAARLGSRQVDVRRVGSGAEALVELGRRAANLVLLDVRMPGMDGLETLSEIKRVHPDVEIVMLTGLLDAALVAEARRLGAADYLTKPVNMPELLDVIDAAVVRSMSRRRG